MAQQNYNDIITQYSIMANQYLISTLSYYYKDKPNIIFGSVEYCNNIILQSLDGSNFIATPSIIEVDTTLYTMEDYGITDKLFKLLLEKLKHINNNNELLYFFICHVNKKYINTKLNYNYPNMIYIVTQELLVVEHRIQL